MSLAQMAAALASANVKELLLLMDTDKSGKISKHEWMKFMEAEFDRLDHEKTGELDPEELSQSRVSVKPVHFSEVGKYAPKRVLSESCGKELLANGQQCVVSAVRV
jgi:Ca2+-binding EF-hand superfamily protein